MRIGRRSNRRIVFHRRPIGVWLLEACKRLGRALWWVGKVAAAVAALAGAITLGRLGMAHVVDSPRFALRELRINPTVHLSREEIVRLAAITADAPGGTHSRLLAIDTDRVAARIAAHAWIASAQVRRELPSTLVVEVTERNAAALAVLGGLYLIDDTGLPFKRATLAETEGLVVLTGISRAEYAEMPEASQAVMREALALINEYQHPDELALVRAAKRPGQTRPAISEVHVDARQGYSLVLYEGGGQVRLGRGHVAEKLARLDEIFADLSASPTGGWQALRTVHLDGPASDRIPVRFRGVGEVPAGGNEGTNEREKSGAPPLRPAPSARRIAR